MAKASSSKIDAGTPNVELLPGTGPGTGKTGVSWRTKPAGLDEFYLMQQDKTRPLEDIRREAGTAGSMGLMYNPRLGGYQNRGIYNQTTGWQQTQPQQPQQPSMTSQQQEWARMAAERQGASANVGATGGAMQGLGKSMTGFNPMFGAGMQAAGAALNAASIARPSYIPNPYLGTREQNIANAKAAGQFDKVRADYNKKNEATGMVMDEEGNITRSPEAYSKIKQEERDLMRGMWREPQTLSKEEEAAGVVSKTAIPSRYGRGSVTTYAPGAARPPSMVKDELGRMVPMSPYLKEKDQIQRSKGMTGGSSVLTTPTTPSTIPVNPLKGKVEERNLFPNAIGEKTQFNEWQNKLAEAKKRGAEGMAKARGGKTVAEQKPMTPKDMERLNFLEAKYGELGTASDEMKALDAARSAMTKERGELYQDIQRKKRDVLLEDPESGLPSYSISFNAKQLAEKNKRLEELEPLIKENYKKSQELGNKRKIPEDVMKEWLELSSRANAR